MLSRLGVEFSDEELGEMVRKLTKALRVQQIQDICVYAYISYLQRRIGGIKNCKLSRSKKQILTVTSMSALKSSGTSSMKDELQLLSSFSVFVFAQYYSQSQVLSLILLQKGDVLLYF